MEDTKNLTLPVSKKIAVIRSYMSRKVYREVQKIVLGKNKTHFETDVNPSAGTSTPAVPTSTKSFMDVDPTVTLDADDKLLELMVLTIGGVAVSPDALDNLPNDDFDFLLAQVQSVKQDSKVEGSDPKVPTS